MFDMLFHSLIFILYHEVTMWRKTAYKNVSLQSLERRASENEAFPDEHFIFEMQALAFIVLDGTDITN